MHLTNLPKCLPTLVYFYVNSRAGGQRNTRVWAGGESIGVLYRSTQGFLLVFDCFVIKVMGPEDPNQLAGVEFEVYGQVQGS